jgi:hypothetical protein
MRPASRAAALAARLRHARERAGRKHDGGPAHVDLVCVRAHGSNLVEEKRRERQRNQGRDSIAGGDAEPLAELVSRR